jgi:hypothetical protein
VTVKIWEHVSNKCEKKVNTIFWHTEEIASARAAATAAAAAVAAAAAARKPGPYRHFIPPYIPH